VSTTIGGILSASVLPFDTDASNWQPDSAFKAGKWVGNAGVLAAATLTAYGVGAWGDKPRVRHAADDALRAQILALGIAYGLKYTVQRERPDQSGHDSFPSGHTAETFAVATVLARHFGPAIWIPAYGVAGYVAASRINQHRHYVSDVTFAAGLGVAVGWNGKGHPGGWALEPRVSPHEAGLQMSRVFAP
jgi:membrane-associated phospholipid phosphatase